MSCAVVSREDAVQRGKVALLVVDLQKYTSVPGYGLMEGVSAENPPERFKYLLKRIYRTVVPNLQQLLRTCRNSEGIDIIYTCIESMTEDGRDRSLDYKLHGFNVPKGSPEADIIDEIAPEKDEIVISKTSCNVFCSTNIEYILRNLGVTQLVVTGMLTNDCVESAVRSAADRGFLVTLIEDACAAASEGKHEMGLLNMKIFARICSSEKVIDEIRAWSHNLGDN